MEFRGFAKSANCGREEKCVMRDLPDASIGQIKQLMAIRKKNEEEAVKMEDDCWWHCDQCFRYDKGKGGDEVPNAAADGKDRCAIWRELSAPWWIVYADGWFRRLNGAHSSDSWPLGVLSHRWLLFWRPPGLVLATTRAIRGHMFAGRHIRTDELIQVEPVTQWHCLLEAPSSIECSLHSGCQWFQAKQM